MSLAAAVPIIGDVVGGAKLAKKTYQGINAGISGAKSFSKVANKELTVIGKKNAVDFFKDTKYSKKVLYPMKQGDYHAFPHVVENFQNAGTITQLKGGDGILRTKLEIPGSYRGVQGSFEFIKEADI